MDGVVFLKGALLIYEYDGGGGILFACVVALPLSLSARPKYDRLALCCTSSFYFCSPGRVPNC